MSLSCDCDIDWCPEPGDIVWYPPEDYTALKTKRRQRCCSCNELIDVGNLVGEINRYRVPRYDSIEEKIYGEDGEVPIASKYYCESCTDLYFSLADLGYCPGASDDMRELVKEYVTSKKLGFLI